MITKTMVIQIQWCRQLSLVVGVNYILDGTDTWALCQSVFDRFLHHHRGVVCHCLDLVGLVIHQPQ